MSEQWIVGRPGGPSGPFWSIVSSSGRVIAMQIPDEATAKEIVGLHAERAEIKRQIGDFEAKAAEVADQRDRVGVGLATYFGQGIDRLMAERDDLAAKLESANKELHDLRIKAGLTPLEVI